MNAIASLTGKYTTTCKLCRQKVAEAPALDIPIVGDPGKRGKKLMQVLTTHLGTHHPQEFAQGAALLDETLSFLVLAAFQHEDPSVDPRIEAIRAQLFARVRKNTLADSMLEHIVAGFGLDPEDAQKVNEAMRSIRDACCEFGEFAPRVPQESKIIPA